ncbi:MAG: hypothetical protein U0746_10865 [Gemmataceae bacterium]
MPIVVNAAPACPSNNCCQPQTAYVQRSYYQPVTSYEAVTNYEPVTSYRTSYYYEPVTSYYYSSYYDPCSGCCQKVATPTTSYRLRSQCNAVTNYVARISYKPVTSYRQSCYWEQVQLPSCPTPAPVAAVPSTAAPPLVPGATNPGSETSEFKISPPAQITEEKTTIIPPSQPSRRSTPIPPPVKAEHVASLGAPASVLTGQVVLTNYSPRSGAKVTFVSATNLENRSPATADADGRFQVSLPAGGWYVYVDNKYHNQLTVRGSEARNVTVMSR